MRYKFGDEKNWFESVTLYNR